MIEGGDIEGAVVEHDSGRVVEHDLLIDSRFNQRRGIDARWGPCRNQVMAVEPRRGHAFLQHPRRPIRNQVIRPELAIFPQLNQVDVEPVASGG